MKLSPMETFFKLLLIIKVCADVVTQVLKQAVSRLKSPTLAAGSLRYPRSQQ